MTHPMPTERWRESLHDDDAGGWRAVIRRVFGGSENPLRWGFPLYSAWGILVRVHIFFPVFVIAELIRTLVRDEAGLIFVAPVMVALFVLVLLHEYGHCLACRKVGGEADEILMWPLGGLAMCVPPRRWRADLITTLGGPGVNAVLLVPLGLATWLVTGDIGTVVFNPFDPWYAAGLITASSTPAQVAMLTLWSFHYVNLLLFAFNMLVPMYPMDCGRVVHALLWRKMGYRDATRVSAIVGLVAAGVMAVVALVFQQVMLIGLALFGGVVCYTELQRLKFEGSAEESVFAESLARGDDEDDRAARAAEKRADRERDSEAAERAEIDRILAKISASGMDSLTKKEKKTLEKASEKGRSGA